MGCAGNDCDMHLWAFSGDEPRCECDEVRKGGCSPDPCGNSVTVLSDDVLWNGCRLRYIKACPGKPLTEIIEDADRLIGDLYCKYDNLLEEIRNWKERMNNEK